MASDVDGRLSCCEMPNLRESRGETSRRGNGAGGWRRGYKIGKSGRKMSCFREYNFQFCLEYGLLCVLEFSWEFEWRRTEKGLWGAKRGGKDEVKR
jgi:hypothetical protein